MFYIITTETFPLGLAATQRVKCYAKCVSEMGVQCQVICINRCEDRLNPIGNNDACGKLDGYSFRYIGASTYSSSIWILNKIHRIGDTFRFMVFSLFHFSKEDKVLFYSYSSLLMRIVQFVCRIKNTETYYELNEHPSIQIRGLKIDENRLRDRQLLFHKLNGFNHVLCISHGLKDLLLRCGFESERICLVNMIVDQQRFRNLEKNPKERYIAYCGAADNNKDGVDQLIKSFAIIANKYDDVKLYIIGPKRADCKNEQLAESLGVKNKILFTGMVTAHEIPQMLKDAEVLVLNRPDGIQAKYGFPTKLGEYLMTGNPVVITSVGDIPLYLEDGISAFISKPNDVMAFAGKIDEALSNAEQSLLVGNMGNRVAEENFTEQRVKTQLKIALGI